ncbi:MAG: CHASE domain-containing protein [Hyphomicrobiaceae bacterium]|nr:CHASE domain-containing protein [Hyphomicrobiaceae bacterium]
MERARPALVASGNLLWIHRYSLLATLLALAASLAMYWVALSAETERHQRAIVRQTQFIGETLSDVMQRYEQVLRAAAGFVRASGQPNERSWRAFTASLNLETEFPGVQGLGYVDVRQPSNASGGLDLVTSIRFLEPKDWRNRRAIGYDMYSEPVRRRAMQQARDTGEPVLSGVVRLLQETNENPQPGGLGYVPIYQGSDVPTTIAARRDRLSGYVYGAFRWGDFISRSLAKYAPGTLQDTHLQVTTTTEDGELRTLFDSLGGAGPPERSSFTHAAAIDIDGFTWNLAVSSLPAFEARLDWSRPNTILLGALAFTAMLATILVTLDRSRARALLAKEALEREIQQRRIAQDHAQLANGELIHRVKNTLAIVSAIASQTARHSPSLPEFTRAFRERLAALGTVHDLLRPDPAYTPDLEMFLRDILKAFGGLAAGDAGGEPRLVLDGPRVSLPRNEAVLLSLLINELATNATKYGAWSGRDGQVKVGWTLEESELGEEVVLVWSERGGPAPAPELKTGFGTQVIQAIERGLRGKVERILGEHGLSLTFRFPRPHTIRPHAKA